MKLTEQQQKELADVKERLAKVEIVVIDETYLHLFQSLRDDIRTLVAHNDVLIQGIGILTQQRDELLEALKRVLPFMATETTKCHGDECRERWCSSCFAEEDAEIAAERGRAALMAARNTLAKVGGAA